MPYLYATRPVMGLFAALLVLVSFRLQPELMVPSSYDFLTALSVFVTCCATMVWNDFQDAEHDTLLGKTFVSEHQQTFLIYALTWWLVALLVSCTLLHYGIGPWLLVVGLIVAGYAYHWTYQFYLLSNRTVALVSAATVWFPNFLTGAEILPSAVLSWVVLTLVAAREFHKDREQVHVDVGYKKTAHSQSLIDELWYGRDRVFLGTTLLYLAAFAVGRFFPLSWLTGLCCLCLVASTFYTEQWRWLIDPAIALFLLAGLTGQLYPVSL